MEETSGLCGKRTLPPLWALDPGSSTLARDDTVYSLMSLFRGLPKSVRQRQRSCLFGRDLRSLWQTDFATPGYWIPALYTPPNRYALWRGPRQAVMTRFLGLVWFFEAGRLSLYTVLIRVNLCNLWMFLLKDWILGQAIPPQRIVTDPSRTPACPG